MSCKKTLRYLNCLSIMDVRRLFFQGRAKFSRGWGRYFFFGLEMLNYIVLTSTNNQNDFAPLKTSVSDLHPVSYKGKVYM